MSKITLNIDVSQGGYIYMQIYNYIKSEIENGTLPYNSRLPSTRNLASHLQVSRNTIDMAYGQLMDEGYIEAYPKRGYFVSDIKNLLPAFSNKLTPAQEVKTSPLEITDQKFLYDFSPYGIDLENFPFATWRKIARDIYYDDRNFALLQSGQRQGDEDFRLAISEYLHQSRGVRCQTEQIIVGAGTEYLLLLLSQLLGKNSIFAMEDPSYMHSYEILKQIGCPIRPIPLDQYGMDVGILKNTDANIAYVTPSHHFPLGIVMPIKRRMELLKWSFENNNRYIIEDDYDSEFRYKGKPIPCLQGINHNEKVIYLGTFSKAIAPSIRISYMVLPKPLLETYHQSQSFYANTVARTEQRLITNFMQQGSFERHLNKMRNIYKSKRDYLVEAFAPYQKQLRMSGENSGLHMLLTFIDGRNAKDVITLAASHKIHIYDLSNYYINPQNINHKSTVILGYGALSMKQLKTQTELLIKILFANKTEK